MTRLIRTVALCGMIALSAGSAASYAIAPSPAPGVPVTQAPVEFGTAIAQVLHSVTKQPLANMPVLVVRILPPQDAGQQQYFITGPDGRAYLSPLPDGQYAAFVDLN